MHVPSTHTVNFILFRFNLVIGGSYHGSVFLVCHIISIRIVLDYIIGLNIVGVLLMMSRNLSVTRRLLMIHRMCLSVSMHRMLRVQRTQRMHHMPRMRRILRFCVF